MVTMKEALEQSSVIIAAGQIVKGKVIDIENISVRIEENWSNFLNTLELDTQ